jgi:hypothetical protein
MKNRVITLLFLLLAVAQASAQDNKPLPKEEDWINADRPDNTNSPSIQKPGTVQLEGGILFRSDSDGEIRQTELLYPRMLLRIGLLDWIELRVEGDHRREEVTPLAPKGETVRTRGLNAVTLGTKVRFYEGEGLVPSIGAVANVTLPFFSTFAPLKVAPSLRLAVSHELSESFTLQYNLGWERAWEEGIVQSQGVYTLAIEKKFSTRILAFAEVFGEKARGDAFAHTLDGGILYRFSPNIQLDVWLGKGLTPGAQDYFIGTGVAYRLPR